MTRERFSEPSASTNTTPAVAYTPFASKVMPEMSTVDRLVLFPHDGEDVALAASSVGRVRGDAILVVLLRRDRHLVGTGADELEILLDLEGAASGLPLPSASVPAQT